MRLDGHRVLGVCGGEGIYRVQHDRDWVLDL